MALLTMTYFSRRVQHLIVSVLCAVGPGGEFGATAGNAGKIDSRVGMVLALFPGHGLQFSCNVTIFDETHVSQAPDIRPLRVPKDPASATG
jgi:hypothetical protein